MTSNYEKTDSENPQSAIRNPQSGDVLRRFVRQRAPLEQCDMCSAGLAAEHQHLVDPLSRQIVCACDPCAILFSNQGTTKYKRVPRDVRFLPKFQLTDVQWDGLMIPINIAFFFHSTPDAKVIALYPSPAGPTESLLALDSWDEIVEENAILKKMSPDVEALLVNRVRDAREYYLVPIDECYKLVGLIRANWRGLSGGTQVWEEIGRFFDELKGKCSDK
ncbi:MAG: hypothetical protein QOC96_1660 [Acidobacteriota bacterium]|jgi:hypothetical protein|nr:hypothetical protein [Acidobacteriota bacterium]